MTNWQQRLQDDYLSHHIAMNANALGSELTATQRAEFELSFQHLLDSQPSGARVLDLGCGTGAIASWLASRPDIQAIGIDNSTSQIEAARRLHPSVQFEQTDGLEYLRANEATFDGIICTDLIEHLPSLDVTVVWLEAALDALRPGGFFFCRVPNAANLIAAHSLYADLTHHRLYTSNTLTQLLTICGFDQVVIQPIRSRRALGRMRLAVEYLLHRIVFAICGRKIEKVFTRNVCASGFRPTAPA